MQRHYTWGDTVSLVESERVGGCAAIHARLLAKDPVHIHCAEECNRLEGKERGEGEGEGLKKAQPRGREGLKNAQPRGGEGLKNATDWERGRAKECN